MQLRSRYIRVAQALEWYPFKRAKLYELISSCRIKSFVLKERGAIRGLRLIDRDSLDDYIESKAQASLEGCFSMTRVDTGPPGKEGRPAANRSPKTSKKLKESVSDDSLAVNEDRELNAVAPETPGPESAGYDPRR